MYYFLLQTIIVYAISVVQKERRRLESLEENNIRYALSTKINLHLRNLIQQWYNNIFFIPRSYTSPPPAYQDICGGAAVVNNMDIIDDKDMLPPKYEDIVFTEEETQVSHEEESLEDGEQQATAEDLSSQTQSVEDNHDLSILDNEMSDTNSVVHLATTDV